VAVGDFEPEEMHAKLAAAFGDMHSLNPPAPAPDLGRVVEFPAKFLNFHDSEVKAVDVDIALVRPFAPRPDTRAERAKRLPRSLAYAMLGRRLDVRVKEAGSGVVSATASTSDMLDFVEFSGISATADSDDWRPALALIEQELRRATEFGFTTGEFDEAKARLRRSYEEAVKTRATRKSDQLAMAITRALHAREVFTDPESDLEWLDATLPGISPAECHAALKAAWSGGGKLVSVTTREAIPDASAAIRAAFESSQATAVEAKAEEDQAGFAYQDFGPPGSIVSRQVAEDLGVTRLVFANNVRVNYKVTDFQKNTIHVSARIGGGKLDLPAGRDGLDLFAAAVMNGGGLVAHSVDDLDRIFAGKKLGVGFAVEDDAFTLAGRTTPEDLHEQFLLLTAYLTAPGYRDEGEREFRKNLPILAMQTSTTPEGVFGSRGQRLLMGGDPRFGLGDPLELGRHTTADVKAWLDPVFKDAPIEVSIVGDFDPAALEAVLLATLGALPARQAEKPAYTAQRQVPPMAAGPHRLEFQSKIPKALNLLVWPTTDRSDIRKARRLSVLGEILADRLRVKIREEWGEAYSPSAGSQNSDTFTGVGYLICYSPGDPDKSAEVSARIREIAAELATTGASEDEFQRALKPMLAGLEVQRRDNRYWLGSVLARAQEKPETLDWARTMPDDFSSITREEVNKLAAEYLAADRVREILITTPPAAPAAAEKDAA
jgi:zinc protease